MLALQKWATGCYRGTCKPNALHGPTPGVWGRARVLQLGGQSRRERAQSLSRFCVSHPSPLHGNSLNGTEPVRTAGCSRRSAGPRVKRTGLLLALPCGALGLGLAQTEGVSGQSCPSAGLPSRTRLSGALGAALSSVCKDLPASVRGRRPGRAGLTSARGPSGRSGCAPAPAALLAAAVTLHDQR